MLQPGLAADCLSQSDAPAAGDEDQLFALAKADPEFFGELYDRYYSRILNYVYRRTFDIAASEEITSNIFFHALRALPSYQHCGKFGAWLYRIAGNEILLHCRVRRRGNQADWRKDYARIRFTVNAQSSPSDVEEQTRQFAMVHGALLQLPERYQTVLSLRYFEGMSLEEIADVLEKKVGTVKSLVHRGLKRLQRKLEDKGATS
jgi:RNA polymerase sigma-70 factor, ECF subfamily